ncbi:hypothetical protein PPL_08590 [Heterostelium album PN500]|uniref:Uncharacterized protein n=1 Tax=Heterostelium pallidum (strain ATCC 26659 / Pp 5 / PN500) TaxID=670386 RepID=D3BJ65_HETP5|nr:hypothetical protein PPL_08590 [Heterostelium album PN500]EFA77945.1 hypothetical protein PPL_08590 [Heterostelium album PN500]|eukprot:XP_020430073.1 hypothetical protein PPL_08590 [Heterostelium album PN500]
MEGYCIRPRFISKMSTPTATTSEKSYTSSISDDSSYLTWIKHYTTNGAFKIIFHGLKRSDLCPNST